MARIISIDYGAKRTGIAVTDPLQLIASGLITVNTEQLFSFLKEYFIKESVEKLIVGNPKNLDNTDTDATKLVQKFVETFKKKFPDILIELVDERYSSKLAFQSMLESGMKKKDRRNKKLVDEISATILLQQYLDKMQNL